MNVKIAKINSMRKFVGLQYSERGMDTLPLHCYLESRCFMTRKEPSSVGTYQAF